ncbi:hypothetical protein OsI_35817 [Oryza sativa Indica Group]|uniref:Squalene cyclase C-terminal domain-containing protein n=1 Tax=Oryza sativa subsp. indica TaxID=39946 RepID=B8BK31_ORYSI|nr:hypothetical protein OsI_35817 [Oryza sativa Indica Group]
MAYLYGKKFVGPITPTILEIREELYNIPYSEIDWKKARDCCAKVYDGCQTWETAFIVQAICSTGLVDEFSTTLEKAYGFLKNSQVLHDLPNGKSFYRHRSKGSWTLSTADNGWSVPDCTGETLQALLGLSKISPKLVGDPIKEKSLYDAVDCLLSFSIALLEYRPLSDKVFFDSGKIMKKSPSILAYYDYVCTYMNVIDNTDSEGLQRVFGTLSLIIQLYPGYRGVEIESCIKNAVMFIENKQQNDGSWYAKFNARYGTWGICFTYGAFFAIRGLIAAGRNYENSQAIRNGCKFLLSKQLSAGGWGEHYSSSEIEVYVDTGSPHAVNTSLAMLTLLYSGQIERDPTPLYCAAKQLISMQLETGEFPQQEHVGCFNSSLYFNYPNYRNLYPIWALGEFWHRLVASKD